MPDDPGMTTDTTSYEPTGTRPRRLVRPTSGRAVGGVAAGLAQYLNIPVGLIRFAFLFAVIFGGLGFLLYALGWLLIRDETETESIAQRVFEGAGGGSSWIGIALVAIAAVIVLDIFLPASLVWAGVLVTVGLLLYRGEIGPGREDTGQQPEPRRPSRETPPAPPDTVVAPPPPAGPRPETPPTPEEPPPPPPPPSILGRLTVGAGLVALGVLAVVDNLTSLVDPQPRHYLALATTVVGLGLLVGAFIGRARWMILLGVFLIPALLASPAAEVDWEGEFQRVLVAPDLGTLQPSYQAAAGSYVFDLTESNWEGQTVPLDVEVAAGEVVIRLPDGVGLTGTARVGIGSIEAPDGERSGVGNLVRDFSVPGQDGTLDVDLDVGAGVVEIYTGATPDGPVGNRDVRFGPGYISVTERNR